MIEWGFNLHSSLQTNEHGLFNSRCKLFVELCEGYGLQINKRKLASKKLM